MTRTRSIFIALAIVLAFAGIVGAQPIAATWSGESGKHCVGAVARPLDSLAWPDAAEKIAASIARVPADKPLVLIVYGHDGNLGIVPRNELAKAAESVWAKVLVDRKPDHVAGDIEADKVSDADAWGASIDPIRRAAPNAAWSNFAVTKNADRAARSINSTPAPVLYGWDGGKPTDALLLLAAQLDTVTIGSVPWIGDANVASPCIVPYLPALYLHTLARSGGGLVMLFDNPANPDIAKAARDAFDASADQLIDATGGKRIVRVLATKADTYAVSTVVEVEDGTTVAVITRRVGATIFSFPGAGRFPVPELPVTQVVRKAG